MTHCHEYEQERGVTDPFLFDVQCVYCGCVYLSYEPYCPVCEEQREEKEALTKD